MSAQVLDVFLTVDTEVWPNVPGWPPKARLQDRSPALLDRIAVDLYGRTPAGSFGIDYQLAALKRWGLRATYFVEPLASGFYGREYLAELVGRLVAAGQDVQLHLHTEWLSDMHDALLPSSFRQFLHEFDEDEQTALIGWGMRALESCGAPRIRAFRAGSYGADAATLRALLRNGIRMDSSYNPVFVGSTCKLPVERVQLQPWLLNGVLEFPVSVFEDYPGHMRHAQLCACSLSEMTRALELAWRQGWGHFTILLHSFELVRDRTSSAAPRPDQTNIRRLEGLCEFLTVNRSRFRTSVYSEVNPDSRYSLEAAPLRTGVLRAVSRVAQQAWARIS